MEINAGEIVEHAVRRQNVNISELSRKMNVNRRTLYNWFQQKSLNADVICGIGEVINYDFSKDFQHELKLHSSKVTHKSKRMGRQKSQPAETAYWMEKYILLLEDYRILLQKFSAEINLEQLSEVNLEKMNKKAN